MDKNLINLAQENSDGAFVVRNIFEKSKVSFLSLSQNVSLSFSHFIKLIQGHNLEKILKKETAQESPPQVVIPGDLLVEITSSETVKQKKSMNLLSGVFLIGTLLGCTVSIFGILLLQKSAVEITPALLTYVGLGFILALVFVVGIPMLLAALEPTLKKVQEKHHDFMERLLSLFQ
jgi:hypothetical protein